MPNKLTKKNRHKEPKRKSMYDILCEDLKTLNRKAFLHRIFYVGESVDAIASGYKVAIAKVNNNHCGEKLTGFLLRTNKYFMVLIEGSERMLSEHFKLSNFGRRKLLIAQHNVETVKLPLNPNFADYNYAFAQRLLENWVTVTANPRINDRTRDGANDVFEEVKKTCFGLRALAKQLESMHLDTDEIVIDLCDEIESSMDETVLGRFMEDRLLLDVEDYSASYGNIPDALSFADISWPVASDYVPRNFLRESLEKKYLAELSRVIVL